MRIALALKGAVVVATVAAGVSIGRAWISARPPAVPRCFVELPAQVLRATRGAEAIETEFKVFNLGGQDLKLGGTSTTCGCTVASISASTVKPGHHAAIRVRGEPPEAGRRTVEVRLDVLNDPKLNRAIMSLTLVGHAPLPHLVAHSGPVRFGNVPTGGSRETVRIETLESDANPPWIGRAECSEDGVTIRGGLAEDVSSEGNWRRTYAYDVAISMPPGRKKLDGSIKFSSEPGGQAVLILPVSGAARPPITVSPSAIVANLERAREYPFFEVRLTAEEGSPPLNPHLTRATTHPEELEVQLSLPSRDTVLLKIRPAKILERPYSAELEVETSHPKMPFVRIPVHFIPIAE